MRWARTIASDIALYNEAKINESIAQDAFFESIAGELAEGQGLYRSRVSAQVDPACRHYWCAVIDIILHERGHIASPIW